MYHQNKVKPLILLFRHKIRNTLFTNSMQTLSLKWPFVKVSDVMQWVTKYYTLSALNHSAVLDMAN